MIVLLFGLLFASITFLFYSYSYNLTCLNQKISPLQIHLFEPCVPLTIQEGEEPYFDQEMVIATYNAYFEKEVSQYVQDYEIKYYFYNTKDGGVCDIKNCQGVEINIEATLLFNREYKRTVYYEIKEGAKHG